MFVTEYNQRCTQRGYEVSEAAGRAYDAVWVLALALNNTMSMYNSNGHINGTGCEDVSGSLVPLERFNYSNAKMGCLIQWNIQRTNIYGVTVRKYCVNHLIDHISGAIQLAFCSMNC